MFSLTSAAARQIHQAASSSGAQEMALRIAARLDADGSMQYGMGFDDPDDKDVKLDLEGVAVVMAEEIHELLDHTVLDFVELEAGVFNFIFADTRQMQATAGHETAGGCAPGNCSGGACGGGSGQGCQH